MKQKKKGFSLAELLVVVAIVAVLVAVSVPMFIHKLENTKERVCESNRKTLVRQIQYQIAADEDCLETLDFDRLQEAADAHCPAGGEYTLEVDDLYFRIVCSVHEGSSGGSAEPIPDVVSKGLLGDYQALVKDNPSKRNDKLRKESYEESGWPVLVVGEKTYTIQPYYQDGKSQTGPAEDRVWLFAADKFDPTFKTNNWVARYVYNTKDGKWYASTNYNGTIGGGCSITYNNIEDLDNHIKTDKHGSGKPKWVELTDYEEREK